MNWKKTSRRGKHGGGGVMHTHRISKNRTRGLKTPPMKCTSAGQTSETVGGKVANKYCLPVEDWRPKYGTLTPKRIMLRKCSSGELLGRVVFLSTNPHKELIDLQEFTSSRQSTTFFADSDADSAFVCNQNVVERTEDAKDKCGDECSVARKADLLPIERYARSFLPNSESRPQSPSQANPKIPVRDQQRKCVKSEPRSDPRPQPSMSMRNSSAKEELGPGGLNLRSRGGYPRNFSGFYKRYYIEKYMVTPQKKN